MNAIAPAQLTDIQRAVQDHFQRGGSALTALAVIGAIAAAVTLAYLLTRRQERSRGQVAIDDPAALFRDLLAKLNLTAAQRRLLQRAARDAGLPHPSVILLSPKSFSRHVENNGTADSDRSGRTNTAAIEALRRALFENQ